MEKITIKIKNLKGLEVNNFDKKQTLLEIFQSNQVDWMHACGGKGRCTTCKAIILEGMKNLNSPNNAELKMIDKGRMRDNERLSCQVTPQGNVEVRVPTMYQLPHMTYEEA